MTTQYIFQDDSGVARLEGTLIPDPSTNFPATGVYVTDAAAAPTTFVTPLVFDHTATTGGLYAWTGSAYLKVGLATT